MSSFLFSVQPTTVQAAPQHHQGLHWHLLNGFQVIIPDDNFLRKFGVKGHSIFSMISNNAKEIDVLLGLRRTLSSKLTI